jgi:hypothetical protein
MAELERILAQQDAKRAELRRMKLARKNANQRNRRAKRRRIDYYVSEAALAIINAQAKPQAACDISSVLNRIVESTAQNVQAPEQSTLK